MDNHSEIQILANILPTEQKKHLKKLENFIQIYKVLNRQINLISRKDIDKIYLRHIVHSLSLIAVFNLSNNSTILDLGTGGGFPGLPLAIVYPRTKFILVDSISKKIKALQQIIKSLNLANVTLCCARAENLNVKSELVLTRAVGKINYLCNISKKLLTPYAKDDKIRGLICLKGGDLKNELESIPHKMFVHNIADLIKNDFFNEKKIVHIPNIN